MPADMQSYFEHLAEDIRKSYVDRNENTQQEIHLAGVMFDNIDEKYAHLPVELSKPIYKWMNLEIEAFPPADRWTELQLREFCSWFRSLFEAYNYQVIIPYDLSFAEEYTYFLQALKVDEVNTLNNPLTDSDECIWLCERDHTRCIFGKHCPGEDCELRLNDPTDGRRYFD